MNTLALPYLTLPQVTFPYLTLSCVTLPILYLTLPSWASCLNSPQSATFRKDYSDARKHRAATRRDTATERFRERWGSIQQCSDQEEDQRWTTMTSGWNAMNRHTWRHRPSVGHSQTTGYSSSPTGLARKGQYNTIQYHAIQYKTKQYGTTQGTD